MAFFSSTTLPKDFDVRVKFLTKEAREDTGIVLSKTEFSGAPKSLVFLHHEKLLIVGVGAEKKLHVSTVRDCAGAAIRYLLKRGYTKHIVFELSKVLLPFTQAVAEGVGIGGYEFDQYKMKSESSTSSTHKSQLFKVEKVTFIPLKKGEHLDRHAIEKGWILSQAVNYARQTANQPANLFYPESFAKLAKELVHVSTSKKQTLEVEVFDEKQLEKEGFGALIAVGKGSSKPPRFIIIRYKGSHESSKEKPLVLIGKGITFDTGGISIKPRLGMEDLIWDKCGGCNVLAAMQAIAKLELKCHVIGIIASAENMVGPDAYRPGDIITTYDGKTVEINNTDAEGRMILADSIAYARKHLNPKLIVDMATLTGAAIVALGDDTAGVWASQKHARKHLLKAGKKAGESFWGMPIKAEHRNKMKSEVALLKNTGGSPGGACCAAAFLKVFAEKTPWIHLDIAGPSAITKSRLHLAHGATGFGVLTLVQLAESM